MSSFLPRNQIKTFLPLLFCFYLLLVWIVFAILVVLSIFGCARCEYCQRKAINNSHSTVCNNLKIPAILKIGLELGLEVSVYRHYIPITDICW
jgi:hypothetical protein